MFLSDNRSPGHSDTVVAEHPGPGEYDIPEPLEHWSEQDFDDLVPNWVQD
jgi:hypothetical protein